MADRHKELKGKCKNGKEIPSLKDMCGISIDDEGNIRYDNRIYVPVPGYIDEDHHINIPEYLKNYQIEVMLLRESNGKREDDDIFHLGVFLGYSYDDKMMVKFSCGNIPRDEMYNIHTFFVSTAYTYGFDVNNKGNFREEIDGGKSTQRRRRTRGSRKRNMRHARSRRRK